MRFRKNKDRKAKQQVRDAKHSGLDSVLGLAGDDGQLTRISERLAAHKAGTSLADVAMHEDELRRVEAAAARAKMQQQQAGIKVTTTLDADKLASAKDKSLSEGAPVQKAKQKRVWSWFKPWTWPVFNTSSQTGRNIEIFKAPVWQDSVDSAVHGHGGAAGVGVGSVDHEKLFGSAKDFVSVEGVNEDVHDMVKKLMFSNVSLSMDSESGEVMVIKPDDNGVGHMRRLTLDQVNEALKVVDAQPESEGKAWASVEFSDARDILKSGKSPSSQMSPQ